MFWAQNRASHGGARSRHYLYPLAVCGFAPNCSASAMRHSPLQGLKTCRMNAPEGPKPIAFLHRWAPYRAHFCPESAQSSSISAPAEWPVNFKHRRTLDPLSCIRREMLRDNLAPAESQRGREPQSAIKASTPRDAATDRGTTISPSAKSPVPTLPQLCVDSRQTREPRQLSPPGLANSRPSSNWVHSGMAPRT